MDIRNIAYEIYKNKWKMDHLDKYIIQMTMDDYESACNDCASVGDDLPSFEDYIHDYGYSKTGIYATFGEFYVNEYRDKDYMNNLLKDQSHLYELYLEDLKTFWETEKINSPSEMREIIEDMWRFLEDVPFSEREDYELYLDKDWKFTDYHHTAPLEKSFNAGTSRTEIWHWFDENHPLGINYLLYHAIDGKTYFEDEYISVKGLYNADFIGSIENKTNLDIIIVPDNDVSQKLFNKAFYEVIIPAHDWIGLEDNKTDLNLLRLLKRHHGFYLRVGNMSVDYGNLKKYQLFGPLKKHNYIDTL